ncbi:MAG: hypothetical protein AABX00_01025 [Nanoarchaeota archaeon]
MSLGTINEAGIVDVIDGILREKDVFAPVQGSFVPGPSKRVLLADSTPEAALLKQSLEEMSGVGKVTHIRSYFDWVRLADNHRYDAYVVDPSLPMENGARYENHGLDIIRSLLNSRTDIGKIWVHGSNIELLKAAEEAPMLNGREILSNVYLRSTDEIPKLRNTPVFLADISLFLRTHGQLGYLN